MKSLQDLGRSISSQLSSYARSSQIPFQNAATAFLIERMVARITAHQDLQKHLVFKGGYVSLRIYGSARYTIDLDALLLKNETASAIEKVRSAIETDFGDGAWFVFQQTQALLTQGQHNGVRLTYRAGYGEPPQDIKRAQLIHFDIGVGDPVVPNPIQAETPTLIDGSKLRWNVYPIETIVAEKLHALCQRGSFSSRSKDIYDLHLFLPRCDATKLKDAIASSFQYRGTAIPQDWHASLSQIDRTLLKKGWRSAVGDIAGAPAFEQAFEVVLQASRILLS